MANTTVAVQFTTDEEAGAVYGTIRRLKHEGYFSSYSMYDDYALLFVPSGDVDTVINVFTELSEERSLQGIFAQVD